MSFLLNCPHCGNRSVYEFRFGGEVKKRPDPGAPGEAWQQYNYTKANEAGVQKEWWYHSSGCRRWLHAIRDTRSNEVIQTCFPE